MSQRIQDALRQSVTASGGIDLCNPAILTEAADKIDQLQAARKRMEEALRRIVRIRDWNHDDAGDARREYDNAADQARAALGEAGGHESDGSEGG